MTFPNSCYNETCGKSLHSSNALELLGKIQIMKEVWVLLTKGDMMPFINETCGFSMKKKKFSMSIAVHSHYYKQKGQRMNY